MFISVTVLNLFVTSYDPMHTVCTDEVSDGSVKVLYHMQPHTGGLYFVETVRHTAQETKKKGREKIKYRCSKG